jgi:uncharacterized protein (TIGR03067 family)
MIVGLFPVLSFGADDANAQLAKLKGDWKIVQMEKGGQMAPKAVTQNITVSFEAGKMILDGVPGGPEGARLERLEFLLTVDPTKSPKHFDTTPQSGRFRNQVQPGIYELDGDNLKLGIPNQPTSERPTELKSVGGTQLVVMTLQRVKK